ncbi:DUF982 domain-containing protein [Rhizobium etli]|uniref:DUF982 domain-containing protein n=1 Tax=Rhizobium etli TaxID=29449 RepID=UPI001F2CCDD8|nr:DUF982 domain-containing protein [Rhizobium etli]
MRIGYGSIELIDGPEKALQALEFRWPPERGIRYLAAKKACIEASGECGVTTRGRDEFVSAAVEADVLA